MIIEREELMKKSVMVTAALLLGAALPAYAGGSGQTTHTSYDAPHVRVVEEPGQVVFMAGYTLPDCNCDCGGNTQLAMNVATGLFVQTEGRTHKFYVWAN